MEIFKDILDNGLKIIVNPDYSSPLVAMNLIYDVGSRDEDPEMTGFAHLFEHLMFGGSANIPSFDQPLQEAGGENNAFTNNDLTNFYISMPSQNIETAFWLESDRMLGLNFSEEGLAVQKKVVIEEFRQRYLNQPFGDAWLHLRPMAYKEHPYRWPTIGREISHIEKARLEDVRNFFYRHYAPNNAILSLCGSINPDEAFLLARKWFGPIEKREVQVRDLPVEPAQLAGERKILNQNVPTESIYMAFHMPGRMSDSFYTTDLISDILAGGNSSRLTQLLVKDKELFSQIDAYITGDHHPGLFVITGKPVPGTGTETAEKEIWKILNDIASEKIPEAEIEKVKNKFEANFIYGQAGILNKAMSLGYFEWLGSAGLITMEVQKYRSAGGKEINEVARQIFRPENCSTLLYHSINKNNEPQQD